MEHTVTSSRDGRDNRKWRVAEASHDYNGNDAKVTIMTKTKSGSKHLDSSSFPFPALWMNSMAMGLMKTWSLKGGRLGEALTTMMFASKCVEIVRVWLSSVLSRICIFVHQTHWVLIRNLNLGHTHFDQNAASSLLAKWHLVSGRRSLPPPYGAKVEYKEAVKAVDIHSKDHKNARLAPYRSLNLGHIKYSFDKPGQKLTKRGIQSDGDDGGRYTFQGMERLAWAWFGDFWIHPYLKTHLAKQQLPM